LILAPRVGAFGTRVSSHVENFNLALPNNFTAKDLLDRLSANVFGITLVKVPNHHLQSFNILFIRHTVRRVPRPSIDWTRRQRRLRRSGAQAAVNLAE